MKDGTTFKEKGFCVIRKTLSRELLSFLTTRWAASSAFHLSLKLEWPPGNDGFHHWSWHWATHRSRDSFSDRNGVMPKEEIDAWLPETRLGYFKLFYFGMLMATICLGGNTALGCLWSTMAIGQWSESWHLFFHSGCRLTLTTVPMLIWNCS